MTAFEIFEYLKNSYEASTLNCNHFLATINCIDWEDKFQADGEYYFCKGNLTFTTPSLNPFRMPWKPAALFSDGSMIEF